jgi:hypothetical protein
VGLQQAKENLNICNCDIKYKTIRTVKNLIVENLAVFAIIQNQSIVGSVPASNFCHFYSKRAQSVEKIS